MAARETKYMRPGFFTRTFANPAVALLSKLGVSLAGSRTLTVRGRKSGEPHTTPVNPLDFGGATYIVSPRGTTQWARNIRVVGEGELGHGRKSRSFRPEEIPDEEKLPILKAYLDKWAWEVGTYFQLPKDPTDDQIQEIAHLHPIFRVHYLDDDEAGDAG